MAVRKQHAKLAQLLKLEASVPPIKLGPEPVDIDIRLTLWADPHNGELRIGLHIPSPRIKRRKGTTT